MADPIDIAQWRLEGKCLSCGKHEDEVTEYNDGDGWSTDIDHSIFLEELCWHCYTRDARRVLNEKGNAYLFRRNGDAVVDKKNVRRK